MGNGGGCGTTEVCGVRRVPESAALGPLFYDVLLFFQKVEKSDRDREMILVQ